MMEGKVVHVGKGIWGPVFEEPYVIVGTFLWADVGCSLECCDLYLDTALEVVGGKRQAGEIQGNHMIVQVMPTCVLIEDMFFNGNEGFYPQVISMDAYVSVLRYWRSIVAGWDGRQPPANTPRFVYAEPTPVPSLSPDEASRLFREAR